MSRAKAQPAWTAPFIAALGVCGNVTRAAALAGVDVTGPYNRRARYPEFRDAWDRALAEREARAAGTDEVAIAGAADEEAVEAAVGVGAGGVRLGRTAKSRWSKGAEARFLEELTASANINRAAQAAGFSAAAIYKRRLRDRHFAAGWEAAIAVGRARLEAHLLAAAERSFDSDALPIAEGAPKVSVGEAISILKHKPAVPAPPPWEEEQAPSEEAVNELREKILDKLARIRERDERERLGKGWIQDGEHWIPPGWVRAEGWPPPQPPPDALGEAKP